MNKIFVIFFDSKKFLANFLIERLKNQKPNTDTDYLAQLTAFYFCHKYKLNMFKNVRWIRWMLPNVKQSVFNYFTGGSIEYVNFNYLLHADYFSDESM